MPTSDSRDANVFQLTVSSSGLMARQNTGVPFKTESSGHVTVHVASVHLGNKIKS